MDFITLKIQKKSLNFVVSCERKPQAITKWKYHSEQYSKPVMQIMNEYDQTVFCNSEEKVFGWEQCNGNYNQKAN